MNSPENDLVWLLVIMRYLAPILPLAGAMHLLVEVGPEDAVKLIEHPRFKEVIIHLVESCKWIDRELSALCTELYGIPMNVFSDSVRGNGDKSEG